MLFLPACTAVLARVYARALVARAEATPLVVGAAGNRFDVTLAALYWRRFEGGRLTMAGYREFTRMLGEGEAVAAPLHVRFTARGVPVVATTVEYFEARRLGATAGTLPLMLGDAAVGMAAARRLGVGVGDVVYSDQVDTFDISRPASLKMHVVGVLARTGTPDDEAVFVDLKTAWLLEGLAHGHADAATQIDPKLVTGRTGEKGGGAVSISEELIERNEVTEGNAQSFHMHATEEMLPLTAVLVFPRDAKAGTMVRTRVNARGGGGGVGGLECVSAREVIGELLAVVGRVRAVLDVFFVFLGVTTLSLVGLVATLSVKLRARETRTLHRIGCSRWFVVKVYALELVIVCVGGACAAGIALGACWALAPGVVGLLGG
jgi:putative ABC transport system permease protein